MELDDFLSYIPEEPDIRPAVAGAARRYIRQHIRSDASLSHAAVFLNIVIGKTGCQERRYRSARDVEGASDPAKNQIDTWAKRNIGKRGDRRLPSAVFYWFFRYAEDPSYFSEVARKIWIKDSELLSRFCLAKEAGRSKDTFAAILDRFRSDEAPTYKVVLSGQERRHAATYTAAVELGPSYQAGRAEFQAAKKFLVATSSKSIAPKVALHGPGGYGKSSLAQELCNDKDVKRHFTGGIYWLQFGLIGASDDNARSVAVSRAADAMFAAQYPRSERQAVTWDYTDNDIFKLIEVLPSERLLLVADDL